MPIITFDTSIFIAYKPTDIPAGFRMSAVVLQELTAGAVDNSEVQRWNAARIAHEKAGTLLVPNGEDWWLAGKVLNSLLRGMKSTHGGKHQSYPTLRSIASSGCADRAHGPFGWCAISDGQHE